MATIQLTWESDAPLEGLDEADIEQAGALYLKGLGLTGVVVNLFLAGDETLAQLNEQFRGKPTPTDVLSWSYGTSPESSNAPDSSDLEEDLFGEIAISLNQATLQAQENGWDLRTELLRLLAHGCTHLAGYDHETVDEEREMREIEIRLLAESGLTGLYPE